MTNNLLKIFSILFLLPVFLSAMNKDVPIEKQLESFFTQWQIGNYDAFKKYPFKQGYTNNANYTKALCEHLKNSIDDIKDLKSFYIIDYQTRTGKKLSDDILTIFEKNTKNLIDTIQIYSLTYPIPLIADHFYLIGDITKKTQKILKQENAQKKIAEHLISIKWPNTALLIISTAIQQKNVDAVEDPILKFREIIDKLIENKTIIKENKSKTEPLIVSTKVKFNSLPIPKKFSFTKNPDSPLDFVKLLYESDCSSSEDDKEEDGSSFDKYEEE